MLGTAITGLRLDRIDDAAAAQLLDSVDRHRVVTVKDQELDPEALIAFANRIASAAVYPQSNYHHPDHPEIFVSANTGYEGRDMGVARTGGYWHIDTAFLPTPHIFTILQPKVLPSNRRTTLFVDLVRAAERLTPALLDALRGADAFHSGRWRYKIRPENVGLDIHEILTEIDRVSPPARHPAVLRHPMTGVECLYLSSGFTVDLRDRATGRALGDILGEALPAIEHPSAVEEFVWEEGDVIIWDNRQVAHRSGRCLVEDVAEREGEEPTVVFRITAFDRRAGLDASQPSPVGTAGAHLPVFA